MRTGYHNEILRFWTEEAPRLDELITEKKRRGERMDQSVLDLKVELDSLGEDEKVLSPGPIQSLSESSPGRAELCSLVHYIGSDRSDDVLRWGSYRYGSIYSFIFSNNPYQVNVGLR